MNLLFSLALTILAPLALLGCAGAATPAARTVESTDQLAIVDTLTRFSAATADRDFATLGGMFTDDAVWEATGDGLGFRHAGAPAIRAALAASASHVTVLFQQVGLPLVRLEGTERASARTSVLELLRVEPDGAVKQITGVYTDELVKQGGRWRFAHRRFDLRHAHDLPRSTPAPK